MKKPRKEAVRKPSGCGTSPYYSSGDFSIEIFTELDII
jgi:hypothetical protein